MKRSTVYLYLALFLLPLLIAFARTPVAWLDETMNLDPAVQWHLRGTYTSKIWPNQGTDRVFLAYLPLVEVFHIVNLSWLPKTLAWIRLPFLLVFAVGMVAWIRLLNRQALKPVFVLIFTALLLTDRAVFEILRSGRSETLELSLLAGVFLTLWRQQLSLAALLTGLLWVAHPKLWVLTSVLSLYIFWHAPGLKYKLGMIGLIAAPALCWLTWLDFPVQDIATQLLGQREGHGAQGNLLSRIWQHNWNRFVPYYAVQPWVPLLHLLTWWPAWQLLRRHGWSRLALPGLLWMAQELFWMFFLAAHYRYLPPHQLLMYLVWALWAAEMQWSLKNWSRMIILAALPFMLYPWASRLAFAFLQWESRDPQAVMNWLDRNLPVQGKTLLIGHSIGHYHLWQRQDTALDFALEIYPQKFAFSRYQKVYYLGSDLPPRLAGLQPIASYNLPPPRLPEALDSRSATYRGLKLYCLPDSQSMEALVGPYRIPYP